MSDKQYVVPEGMLKAVHDASRNFEQRLPEGFYFAPLLKAALRGLSENPIVPTDEQIDSMSRGLHWGWDSEWRTHVRDWCVEWQRRMFLAPEPAVPEGIKGVDAFSSVFNFNAILERPACAKDEPVSEREKREGIREHVLCVRYEDYTKLYEAYRRGQLNPIPK